MTQPLNYTTKAIADFSAIPWTAMPIAAAGCRYLTEKLRQAQVFVLSDHGELLDRSRPRPEVPGVMFRPPFEVVALEYTAVAVRREDTFYTAARSSKRIALAWEWKDDLPAVFGGCPELPPGVVVGSLAYIDVARLWMPMSGVVHLAYDDEWKPAATFPSAFRDAMIASGHYTLNPNKEKSYPITGIPLMLEQMVGAARLLGSKAAALDAMHADVADELNAYIDLSFALACKNVSTRHVPAPAALNKQRLKSGKLPLKDFHVLELAGGGSMPGGGGAGDRNGPRSHLRRGHIRRLDEKRVTWVNSTVVRGRGFVDKVYAA